MSLYVYAHPGNHWEIASVVGFEDLREYRYFKETHVLDFEGMIQDIQVTQYAMLDCTLTPWFYEIGCVLFDIKGFYTGGHILNQENVRSIQTNYLLWKNELYHWLVFWGMATTNLKHQTSPLPIINVPLTWLCLVSLMYFVHNILFKGRPWGSYLHYAHMCSQSYWGGPQHQSVEGDTCLCQGE